MIQASRNEKVFVRVRINGKLYEEYIEPRKLLSDFIREDCGLTGTHVGCEHGVCGACTIRLNGAAVRSCLILAVQADDSEIITVEGLAANETQHPLQEAFASCHALQCGFCTPGILMSAAEFLEEHKDPMNEQIEEMLSGHLCRCTGYKGIVEAIAKVAKEQKTGR